jgi:cold shock CspA family protein/ribosome-associated translation inhibitor RaiA
MELHIAFQGMPPSPAVEQRIRELAAKLERFHGRITACRVVVGAPHRRHAKGELYTVRVDLTVPGHEILATKDRGKDHAHEDVYVAIRDAFDAAARQLEDVARRARGDVKHHEAPAIGRVSKLFPHESYGFLESDDGGEVYFHANSVLRGAFPKLTRGSAVRFVVAEGEGVRGPQASTVELLG